MIKLLKRPGLMQDIPRAILLPPPSASRSARGPGAADRDLSIESGARRSAPADAGSFLTLIDTQREDSVEFSADFRGGKQFRFRPYTNRGGSPERGAETGTLERPAADQLSGPDDLENRVAHDVLDGFSSGDGTRNSSAFLASFIAQERLSDGLYNPAYRGASDAYRRAGGSPPPDEAPARLISVAA